MSETNYQKSDSKYLFETIGITKVFESHGHLVTAISDISIKIGIKEFVIFFGSSASGKSTLLSMIYGLDKPDIGEVLVKGEPLYEFSENERAYLRLKRFGFLPQGNRWISSMSLLDNVALPLLILGEGFKKSRKTASTRLRKYGLGKDLLKRPVVLNAYKQKVASLIRAAISRPWAVFLDEPYLGLNSEDASKFMAIINELRVEQGVTILMTSNDAQYLKYASKWYFLHDGHLDDIESNKKSLVGLKEAIELVEKKEKEEKTQHEIFNVM